MDQTAGDMDLSDFSQGQLDKLNAMIASGILRSEYDGQRLEYRSLDELIRARDIMRGGLGTSSTRVTHVNPTFSRGI
ncbi:MAG: hypothetical protein V4659_03915 [Pseudomonadota bacterium]